ncbi:MAG TPA: redoxin domain-containing protein [Virgibacillus sp.]|nr:redoxin domain-containing protein [Virgibacillus sp.]
MKKGIIIAVIVGMFGWAVYDFAIKSDDSNEAEQDEYVIEDESGTPLAEPDEPQEGNDTETGLEAGDVAPDFELETLEGETVKLSDYRGERVMLNFWATWCPPCRAEMPDMQKFHEDTDVVILAVDLADTESNEKNVPEFVDEFGLTFEVLLDKDSGVANQYQIKPIPTSFLIDSEGVIHNKALGALNYELMIQEFEKMK